MTEKTRVAVPVLTLMSPKQQAADYFPGFRWFTSPDSPDMPATRRVNLFLTPKGTLRGAMSTG